MNYDSFAVGLHLQSQGVKAQHPVIMVPGVISTGLESWGTGPDSRQYFRKRLWGVCSPCKLLILVDSPYLVHLEFLPLNHVAICLVLRGPRADQIYL